MKNIVIAGRLGKDAKSIKDGKCLSFSVAVDSYSKREKETIWFQVFYWGGEDYLEKIEPMLTKGAFVVVSGDVFLWEKEDVTPICVNANRVTVNNPPKEKQNKEVSFDDDDVPF